MMYCKCDNCGKEKKAIFTGRNWTKPSDWFEKENMRQYQGADGEPTVIQVCSKECIEEIEKKLQLFRLNKIIKTTI